MKDTEFHKKSLEVIKYVQNLFPEPIYLVGGAVRSMLMGEVPKDFDFCSKMTTQQVKECIKGKHRAYLIGERFGTVGFKVLGEDIEITQFRSETYNKGDRKPNVKYIDSLHEDLSRRDFTINAICMRICKNHIRIIDNFGGIKDLESGLIRAVGHPKQRFKEDPLRMLRAIRFACRFDFDIEIKTYEKMRKMAINILNISKERWMMELDKILMCDDVNKGLRLLWESNLFKFMIPELHLQRGYNQNSQYHSHNLDVHTAMVVEVTPKDINLRWAALLHDISKPFVRTDKLVQPMSVVGDKYSVELVPKVTKSNYIGHEILGADMVKRIATHLKWSNERSDSVINLVRNHLKDDCPLREYDNLGKS